MTLPPLPTPPAPAVAPGWTTSEFWVHLLAAVAIAVLTALQTHSDALPPLAKAAVELVAPLALAWLAKSYGDSRSDVKVAALNAGAAAAGAVTSSSAAAVLRGSP